MAEVTYWLWLTTRKGLGAVGALTVLDHFITPERAYYGEREDYEPLPLSDFAKEALLDKSLDEPNRILGECDRLSMRIMTFQDADYPQRLRQIADPPAVLYIKGRTFRFDEEAAIGVVGTRSPAQASRQRAERFGMELAANGALVVSGIAEGIDSCAVRGALKGGGPVVCLLAGGADLHFPKENRFLYDDVAAVGALISEYPPGTPHKGSHFNPRNRILSGLCLGVLAVECGPSSGTMLTVNHALDQGREVYAVPIGLDERCARGTNALIRDYKARLVEKATDILEDFAELYPAKLAHLAPLSQQVLQARLSQPDRPREREEQTRERTHAPGRERIPQAQQKSRFTDDELSVLAAAADRARSADELVEQTQIPAKRVLSALTMLQIQGAVEERPGRRFYALVELEG
ncbi:MAG: DNA-processing protein DprA [Lawsonibacter sp.]|nr:DNA-processing protein DprA [Lawsonibacter sp.]